MQDLLAPEARDGRQRAGLALCLSGGGYRAMVFHAGALQQLNELGYLPRLDFVSSVSGGSLAAGVLALAWRTCGSTRRPAGRRTSTSGWCAPLREMARSRRRQALGARRPAHPPAADLRPGRRRLPRAPLRRRHAPGPARRPALHLLRDQPADDVAVPLLQALRRRLPARPGPRPRRYRSPSPSGRRRPSRPSCRRRRCASPPAPGTRRSRRSWPRASATRSCSPTAGSTTTSAWSR